jgi:Zn-dependent metalloprotease
MKLWSGLAISALLCSTTFAISEKINIKPGKSASQPAFFSFAASVNTPEDIARQFIASQREDVDVFNTFASVDPFEETEDLQLKKAIQSKASSHVIFQQTFNGLPIFGQVVKVHINEKDQSVMLMNGNWVKLSEAKDDARNIVIIRATEAIENAIAAVGSTSQRRESIVEEIYIATDEQLVRGYKVIIFSEDPFGEFVVLVDGKTGDILKTFNQISDLPHQSKSEESGYTAPWQAQRNELIKTVTPPTESISGKWGWVHSPSLYFEPAMKAVALPGLDDSGNLSDKLLNVFSGDGNRANSSDGHFGFLPDNPRYHEVMAYYHISDFWSYLQSLGFKTGMKKLEVVVHYGNGDNSFYSPETHGLYYGDGGIPDSEDADIILHEFGHAVVTAYSGMVAYPDDMSGAMHEGFADYTAATYFDSSVIGEWDITGMMMEHARDLKNEFKFPNDMTGECHNDGMVWSGALWSIREEIGKRDADKLVYHSLAFLPTHAEFQDGLVALLSADEAMFKGRYRATIIKTFFKRGVKLPSRRADLQDKFNELYE